MRHTIEPAKGGEEVKMLKKHVIGDLVKTDIMGMHGYSSREIFGMSDHQLTALYNEIFEPIDIGDLYTISEDEYEDNALEEAS